MKLYMTNSEGNLEEQANVDKTVYPIGIAAEKVADLWIEQMQKPFNKDNGDNSDMLFMLSTMATQGSQQSLNPSSLAVFRKELVDRIVAHFAKHPTYQTFALYADYGPDEMLADAARVAGIDYGVFPWKSAVRIFLADNKIEYSFGYSKAHQTVSII